MINWSATEELASLLTLKNNYKFCFIKMIVINSGYFKNEVFSLIAIGENIENLLANIQPVSLTSVSWGYSCLLCALNVP